MKCLRVFVMSFFCSSRRRHTRCALVTGAQTCALPIWRRRLAWYHDVADREDVEHIGATAEVADPFGARCEDQIARRRILDQFAVAQHRSEERRVGKECVSTCRSRWLPYH